MIDRLSAAYELVVTRFFRKFGLKYWVVEDFDFRLKIVREKRNPKSCWSDHTVWSTVDGPFYTQEDALRALHLWRKNAQHKRVKYDRT